MDEDGGDRRLYNTVQLQHSRFNGLQGNALRCLVVSEDDMYTASHIIAQTLNQYWAEIRVR